MTKQVNSGYVDTPISGVSSLTFPRGLVNFGADFRKKTIDAQQLVITNLTSPVDRPETFRFARSEVANIYNGTGIAPGYVAPSTKGFNLLVQLSEVVSVTDDSQADFEIHLPVSAHLVIKAPQSEYIDSWLIQNIVGRLVSGIFDTGSETRTRLDALMRGSLSPTDM